MAGEVVGLPDLKRQLEALPRVMRRRVLRNALAAGARLVRDEARRRAPVLSPENSRRAPYRQPGTVRKAISVRTSKDARREGNVGVFVNVRPARKGAAGARNPQDPFYWRFLEFGTKKMAARPFLQPATAQLRQALTVFETEVVRWINKVNARGNVS